MDLHGFILEHENDDLAALMLQRDRYPSVDMALATECIASRRKLRLKVPQWYGDPRLICPATLSAEQCSSTATARYKATIAATFADNGRSTGSTSLRIADLTGGLGIDCWQFSKVAESVLYNEMNPLLVGAARENFPRLGCDNVSFSNLCIGPDTLPDLLDSFKPNLVFADPARRSASGRKVFLPEDCSPDILTIQDIILERGCSMLLKLSPMADISLVLRKFHCVKQIHIIEADRECKELLLLMVPGFDRDAEIIVTDTSLQLSFSLADINGSKPRFIIEPPAQGQLFFEPGPALSKCGAFNALCERFGFLKFGPSAHLYLLPQNMPQQEVTAHSMLSQAIPPLLSAFGKCFRVIETAPFGKASLEQFALRWPEAGVTARALPLSSDELRQKIASIARKKPARTKTPTGSTADRQIHIFGAGTAAGRLLVAAERTIT